MFPTLRAEAARLNHPQRPRRGRGRFLTRGRAFHMPNADNADMLVAEKRQMMSSACTRFIADSSAPVATCVLSTGRLSALDLPARRSPSKKWRTLARTGATSLVIVQSARSRLRALAALLMWRGMMLGMRHSLPRCALPSREIARSDTDHESRKVGTTMARDHGR